MHIGLLILYRILKDIFYTLYAIGGYRVIKINKNSMQKLEKTGNERPKINNNGCMLNER
jgi:hypothetical protein